MIMIMMWVNSWLTVTLVGWPLLPPPKYDALSFPHLHWRLMDTHRQFWLSLLWGHCSFLLGPGAHKVLSVPSKGLFPSPVEVLQSNPTGLQSQIPWGFWVPFLPPQVGKFVVSPRTFFSVREIPWCNTRDNSTHGHHQMVNTKIRLIIFLQPKMEKLYTVSKNKTRSWLWLRSWTPYFQIQT